MDEQLRNLTDGPPIAYATFTRRARALAIDSAIVSAALVALLMLGDVADGIPGSGQVLVGALFALAFLYEPVLVWRRGATIGHRAARLRVVDERSGGNPGLGQALLRFALKLVLGLPSFATMALTRRHQAVHDWITGTTVRVPDAALLSEADYHLERTADPTRRAAPLWRRVLVIGVYLIIVFLLFSIAVNGALAPECVAHESCSEGERLGSQLLSATWLAASVGTIIAGWRGWLPGARSTPVEHDPPAV